MDHSIQTVKLEEQLRAWTGETLGGHGASTPPPEAQPSDVAEFVRAHGVELLVAARVGGDDRQLGCRHGESSKHAAASELARTHEFVHAIRAMQRAGLDPIVFKGQALAHSIYPQPWLRPRTDFDVLIEREDFECLIQALAGRGYERATAIDGDLVLPQQSLYRHAQGIKHVWDIHWRISNRPALSGSLSTREIRANTVKLNIDGTLVCTPDRVYSLLIACLHLVGHHADEVRMIWLYDIHLLAGLLNEQEQQQFLERACASVPVRAACHATFSLTQRYIPTDCTKSLGAALDPGPDHRWQAGRSYAATLWEDVGSVTPKQRLLFMTQHAFPSAEYMTKRFAIRHRWHLPFWYAIRIGRALPKLFRRQ